MRLEAEDARRERRARAARAVARAPIKVLLPMALLVLPVTLIVVLGPAVPTLIRIARGG
jgi:pilus assembly protein TadC